MNLFSVIILLFLATFITLSCGQDRAKEEYSLQTSGDLLLTTNNHPHGYGEGNCFYCHNGSNIHRDNNLGTNLVDLANSLVERDGIASCSLCHGTNGVVP